MQAENEKLNQFEPEMQDAEATPFQRLNCFLGVWQGRGYSYWPAGGPAQETTALDTYDWLEGEFFLLHRWKWDISGSIFEGLEILGWDDERNEYFSNMYDNAGHQVRYHLEVKNDIWHYLGEMQKGKITVTDDKLSSLWHGTEDGKLWSPLCEIQWIKYLTN